MHCAHLVLGALKRTALHVHLEEITLLLQTVPFEIDPLQQKQKNESPLKTNYRQREPN